MGSCQTARPIGTKFGTCLRIRLGMDIAKYNSPLKTTGGISGVLGGHKIKSGKAAKRMDRLAPNSVYVYRPTIHQGHFGGFLGGHKFKCLGKLSTGWTDWYQIWYTSPDSSWNGHRLNTIRPSIPQGFVWGVTNSKVWGSCQTTGLIGTTFGKRLRIRLGMDIG